MILLLNMILLNNYIVKQKLGFNLFEFFKRIAVTMNLVPKLFFFQINNMYYNRL